MLRSIDAELPKLVKALKQNDKVRERFLQPTMRYYMRILTLFWCSSLNEQTLAQAAMQSIRRLLLFFLEKGDLRGASSAANGAKKAKPSESADAVDKFRKWLWSVYTSFVKEMLEWLHGSRGDANLQVGALRTLMEFVAREGEIRQAGGVAFGNETFKRVVQQLVTSETFKGEVAKVFKGEYVSAYVDVQYYMVHHPPLNASSPNRSRVTDTFHFVNS